MFGENTGVAERTLHRLENQDRPITGHQETALGLAIAARLYGLPPWGADEGTDDDS